MEAVILAGGKGTRLRPFTATIPKPLLPLGETPILEVVLQQLARAGFSRIHVALNHMAPLFSAVIGDGRRFGVEVRYVLEDQPLGTAGALRLIKGLPDHFLVMNGDILTTLDFADFFRWHVDQGALASVALARRSVAIDYGVIEATEDGRMANYREKPVLDYSVSMGVYSLSLEALAMMPTQGLVDMPSLFMAVHDDTDRAFCYRSECYWQDIGRIDDYEQATADFEADPSRFLLQ